MEESSTADVSSYIALIHDVDNWRLTPLPANYRLRYICERGMYQKKSF